MRRDPDPVRRGQRATELITVYQQRATELARLRRAAIEEARDSLGLNYSDIAGRLGLTKGRIAQIRSTAPDPERAFFGVGPVSVGIPRRFGIEDGRERPYFDADDMSTRGDLESLLMELAFVSTRFEVDPDRAVLPAGDVVLVCGPKSAPVARELLASDPTLQFTNEGGRWWIVDAAVGMRFDSPYRRDPSTNQDVGYFARHLLDGRVVVHIAGITSIGSRGVATWVRDHLASLFRDAPDQSVSGAVLCDFDDDHNITGAQLVAGPHRW
ncbi:sigma-70 family RNA polymerase sigma factor [Nocardia sp. bgisy118]|uniref:sigma-70 family RNA polymerase sigma factor n=1 Tax=Nocardia sp. bgisy118 TaxID=3413786 RepID=UPI003F49D973